MKKFLVLLGIVSTLTMGAYQIIPEQVGIGSSKPDASASLHLTGVTKGFIPNKMTTAQRNAIPSPANGLMIYNTNLDELQLYNGAGWITVGAGGAGGVDAWATATVYAVDDVVIFNQELYLCQTNHTSGVFATDLASGYWLIISGDVSSTGTITDTSIPRFVGTSGNVIDSSGVTIDASNNVAGAASIAVGGSLDSSSILDTVSTTKGTRPCPSMSEIQRDAIVTPATGLCVYNTDTSTLNVYNGSAWVSAGGGISLWATAKSYKIDDVVIESDRIYRALVNHTSGTFATDLANGDWTEVSGMQVVDLAAGVTGILPTANGGTGSSNLGSGVVKASSGALSTGTVDLTLDVNGILPIANGGTGSATQNFVDLTTNQTVAGEKTFSNTLKSDSIQTTGSSGVVIKNSSGTQVADFGPANTTNASIVGGLNVGGNVTGANLSGTNTGDTEIGNDAGNIGVAKEFDFPNSQVVQTDSTNKKFRIESGNNNELYNGGFEAETLAVGWTVSNATSSSSTTRIEGSKSLSLALTGALSLSQSSTINASQKSGVQMVASIWVNSSDVSDLRLCSLKNGSEDKCTVTGGYVQGSGWRQLTVSFLGNSTSNGLKLKSTDTTGTVLVDQAYVGIGSPIVDFTPDNVYSAFIGAGGLVTQENTDFIDGNCSVASNVFTCNFKSGVFSVDPNCVITVETGAGNGAGYSLDGVSPTAMVYRTYTTTTASPSAQAVSLICQKQGADYKTSKAYVASSSDYDWTAFTPTSPNGSATISSSSCRKKREGSDMLIYCTITTSASSGAEARIAIPDSLTSSSSLGETKIVGSVARTGFGATYFSGSVLLDASVGYLTFGRQTSGGGSFTKTTGSNAFGIETSSFNARIPIQGWTDSSVIVGSFQGYNETPGTSRVETFSVVFGTTNKDTPCTASPCSYISQIGNAVTNITRSGTGLYNLNLSKTYSKANCTIDARCASVSGGTVACIRPGSILSCENCNSVQFAGANTGITLNEDIAGTIMCQGIPQ